MRCAFHVVGHFTVYFTEMRSEMHSEMPNYMKCTMLFTEMRRISLKSAAHFSKI